MVSIEVVQNSKTIPNDIAALRSCTRTLGVPRGSRFSE